MFTRYVCGIGALVEKILTPRNVIADSRGSVASETMMAVALVGLAGMGGMMGLGRRMDETIVGRAHGAPHARGMAVSSQAGVDALRVAELAVHAGTEASGVASKGLHAVEGAAGVTSNLWLERSVDAFRARTPARAEVFENMAAAVTRDSDSAARFPMMERAGHGNIKSPGPSLDSLVGIDDLKDAILDRFRAQRDPRFYGVFHPQSAIFEGPSASGKTTLAHAFAGEVRAHRFVIDIHDVLSDIGRGDDYISRVFAEAKASRNAVIIVEDLDLLGKYEDLIPFQSGTLRKLIDEMDRLGAEDGVTVIGTAINVENIDSALRRAGRFHDAYKMPADSRRFGAHEKLPGTDGAAKEIRGILDGSMTAERASARSGAGVASRMRGLDEIVSGLWKNDVNVTRAEFYATTTGKTVEEVRAFWDSPGAKVFVSARKKGTSLQEALAQASDANYAAKQAARPSARLSNAALSTAQRFGAWSEAWSITLGDALSRRLASVRQSLFKTAVHLDGVGRDPGAAAQQIVAGAAHTYGAPIETVDVAHARTP